MNKANALRPPKPHQIYQPPPDTDDGFSRFVGISIALHLLLLAVFTLRAVIYPNEPLTLERAIRVDIVGLPEKRQQLPAEMKEELKTAPASTPAPAPEPKQEVAKPAPAKPVLPNKSVTKAPDTNKVNLNQTKKNQESALKRLEALQKLESEMNAKKLAEAKPAPVRGNQVSPGSSLTGIAKIENDSYLTNLDEHVKKFWDLPNFLARANLSASAVVYIDESGNVIKKVLARSSGNEIFDASVMSSIEKASPFPPPPSRLVNVFAVDGIQLGFPD